MQGQLVNCTTGCGRGDGNVPQITLEEIKMRIGMECREMTRPLAQELGGRG